MNMLLKTTFITLLFASSFAHGAYEVVCEGVGQKVLVRATSATHITVSLNGESAPADGFVSYSEIDLVARFPRQGEMTLYATVGKADPDSYLFLKGKRIPVVCR